ncbi:hypothetical protein [Bradyrhizobium sp. CCBAU 51627]|uniref:hypothetical protein n=1 Tax=Bradyrhizobium sp. CCBAU 51627 TaxID=1325088 RepID=UPI002304D8D5|nr:hypothetical protein [Bradyrhizobium sp. CCBAU 51627]
MKRPQGHTYVLVLLQERVSELNVIMILARDIQPRFATGAPGKADSIGHACWIQLLLKGIFFRLVRLLIV